MIPVVAWEPLECGKGFDTGPPQVGAGSLSFCGFPWFWPFSLGSRPAFLPSRPYFRVAVSVEVFLSTETSPHLGFICFLKLFCFVKFL